MSILLSETMTALVFEGAIRVPDPQRRGDLRTGRPAGPSSLAPDGRRAWVFEAGVVGPIELSVHLTKTARLRSTSCISPLPLG